MESAQADRDGCLDAVIEVISSFCGERVVVIDRPRQGMVWYLKTKVSHSIGKPWQDIRLILDERVLCDEEDMRVLDGRQQVKAAFIQHASSVVFLYSSPISLPQLNTRAEFQAIAAHIPQTRAVVATSESLRDALASGPELLHISAHPIPDEYRTPGVVLECESGLPQLCTCSKLATFGLWGKVGALVLLVGNSEEVARSLLNHGLARCICCRGPVLDRVCHMFSDWFYQHLSRGDSFAYAFDSARSALRLDGLHAEGFMLLQIDDCGLIHEAQDPSWQPELANAAMAQPNPMIWPETEQLIGRERVLGQLALIAHSQRITVALGSKGVGKSALCRGLSGHASTPGRALATRVVLLTGNTAANPDVALTNAMRSILPSIEADSSLEEVVENARSFDRAGKWLLVVDDADSINSSTLAKLLRRIKSLFISCQHLHVLVAARHSLASTWLETEAYQFSIPVLEPVHVAKVFLRRVQRPLYDRDFSDEGGATVPLQVSERLLESLIQLPLFAVIGGDLSMAVAAATQVNLGMPSLLHHPLITMAAL